MADQIERAVETLTNCLNKLVTSIQKTQSYIDANTFTFGGNTIINSAGASGLLALLEEITELVGSFAGVSNLVSVLDSQPGCDGLVAGISGDAGVLNVTTELIGTLVSITALLSTLRNITLLCSGNIAGISDENGVLKVSTQLIGNAASGTVVFGSLA